MSDIIAAFVHNATLALIPAWNGSRQWHIYSFYLCSIRSSSLGGGFKIHDLPHVHACMRACGMLLIYVLFGLLFDAKLQSNKREVRRKIAVIESTVQRNHRTDNNQWFILVEKLITRTGLLPEMSFQHTHTHTPNTSIKRTSSNRMRGKKMAWSRRHLRLELFNWHSIFACRTIDNETRCGMSRPSTTSRYA